MKSVTYRKFQCYVDGHPVPVETALQVSEKERAKLHHHNEALKLEVEELKESVKLLSLQHPAS